MIDNMHTETRASTSSPQDQVRGQAKLLRASIASGVVCVSSVVVAVAAPSFSSGDEFDVFIVSAWVLAVVTAPSLILAVGFGIAAYIKRRRTERQFADKSPSGESFST
jgi:hypothetical protein